MVVSGKCGSTEWCLEEKEREEAGPGGACAWGCGEGCGSAPDVTFAHCVCMWGEFILCLLFIFLKRLFVMI